MKKNKKVLSASYRIRKGELDDDYILYDNGEVVHNYDKSRYPGGYNLTEQLTAEEIGIDVKERLLSSAPENNKILVKQILGLDKK